MSTAVYRTPDGYKILYARRMAERVHLDLRSFRWTEKEEIVVRGRLTVADYGSCFWVASVRRRPPRRNLVVLFHLTKGYVTWRGGILDLANRDEIMAKIRQLALDQGLMGAPAG